MKIVTGANGIIGSHVLLEIALQGVEVIGCIRRGSDVSKTKRLFEYYDKGELYHKVVWREVNTADLFALEELVRGAKEVYHCAGLVSFDPAQREHLFKVNEKLTADLVNACLQERVDMFCHVSSIATINNRDHYGSLDENVFWKKSGKESDYAWSKYNAEREVWRGMEEGLKAVIVNPGVVLSPGFWEQSSSRLFKVCDEGNRYYTTGKTAYVGAVDVARAIRILTEGRHTGNRYILSEGNYTFLQILNMICDGLDKARPSSQASPWMLKAASIAEALASPFTSRERRITRPLIDSAFSTQDYSNAKIKEVIQFSFKPVPALIQEICEAYRSKRI